ncbi:MAG: gamma-glutamylcyclotransferase, partial [Parasporobacterium sp.]|nr:gamma-glutamylcyclotransferase [Parasporobacterium sp.]
NKYDIFYRAHVQGIGWMNWVSNGAIAGTTGQGLRMEAIQIILLAKDGSIVQDSSPNNNILFVYGTLMNGQRSHSYMDGALFLGSAVLTGYDMYNITNYPALVPGGTKSQVKGELYVVSDDKLAYLDWMEDEGRMYKRVKATATALSGQQYNAYVYEWMKGTEGYRQVPLSEQPWSQWR